MQQLGISLPLAMLSQPFLLQKPYRGFVNVWIQPFVHREVPLAAVACMAIYNHVPKVVTECWPSWWHHDGQAAAWASLETRQIQMSLSACWRPRVLSNNLLQVMWMIIDSHLSALTLPASRHPLCRCFQMLPSAVVCSKGAKGWHCQHPELRPYHSG